MNGKQLEWTVKGRNELLRTAVFRVTEQEETAQNGYTGRYVAIDAPDWVVIVPVYGQSFVLVRQWRHGSECVTTEFPGGVCDPDEDPAAAAARELEEETGFRAGRLTKLGECSPNPALFQNRLHVFLAEDLTAQNGQHLDADEFLHVLEKPISEVIGRFGEDELMHAYTGTALAFYLRHRQKDSKSLPGNR